MGANLTGLANTLKNKIYQAKKKGIDTSFIPRGYSKLPDTQLLNLINRLGQETNGKNYSYQGINNTITPKIQKPKNISPRSNLGKYMKKTGINDINIAQQNLKDIEHYARQLKNFKKHMLPGMKLRYAYGDIQKLIDLGYDKTSNIINKEDKNTLRKIVGLFSQAIDEKISDTDLRSAMARQGLGAKTQEKLLKKFDNLNNVQKLNLNSQLWDRFQLKYPKYMEEYNNAPSESEKEKVIESIWKESLNDKTIYR